ncbi:alpha/beta fold hydrolase [Kosakonia sp. LAM2021]|uniref:alpha/beta fold hydrolase n=1 Tax=Kosakonia sp. LAM2021 TaxID=2800475 RepID=UPI00190A2D4C|nr:alpha/beta hydrolase [Kosakonia sp. LAM2021]
MAANTHFPVRYQYADADGVKMFYREAGNPENPVLLLLHGFPSSSHQFRELIPLLADKFHLIAPDLPGFGFTEVLAERDYSYSFDGLANTLIAFVDALNLQRFAMYVFDYGAPTGLRLALHYPQRVSGFISQNSNAYLEGLGDAWAPVQAYWQAPTAENRQIVHDTILNLEGTKWQYLHGARDPETVAPEGYQLDTLLMERPGNKAIQLDLFLDYANNLKRYPEFQAFFRTHQPPALIIWGEHDPFFIPPGAHAYKRDNPNAVVELLDTGHFALETHVGYIAQRIRDVIGNAIG